MIEILYICMSLFFGFVIGFYVTLVIRDKDTEKIIWDLRCDNRKLTDEKRELQEKCFGLRRRL